MGKETGQDVPGDLATQDLRVDISASYDPQFEEDLTPPNLLLLDSLTAEDLIEISVHSNEDVSGRLGQLPAVATAEGIRLELTHGMSAAGEADNKPDVNAPPHADTPPTRSLCPLRKAPRRRLSKALLRPRTSLRLTKSRCGPGHARSRPPITRSGNARPTGRRSRHSDSLHHTLAGWRNQ